MSDIDVFLRREVKDGKQYEGLIPASNCTQKDVGIGMTDLSVREMAAMVEESLIDTSLIAPLFQKSSLNATCAAIYKFAYDHFQYKADTAVQYLRSPACSWSVRYDGIDCKSYSIIASSILSNLGIIHYIRQIKQPGFAPDMWTHVYVVVPVDQKTGSLSKGHYTIDGTIATMIEPVYTQKSDLKMSMQHYALRGAVPKKSQRGLGIALSDVTKMFSGGWAPSCIGGTHDMNDFNKTMASIVPWFDDAIYKINDAIRNNKPIIDLVNVLLKNTQEIKEHSSAYSKYAWDSKCSKDATKAYADLGLWYYNIVFQAFIPWLENYFTVSYGTATVKKGDYIPASEFTKTSFNGGTIDVKVVATITLKASTSDIKAFEITPYVQDTKNQSSFNVLTFLSGLNTTIASFSSPGATTTTKPTTTGQIKQIIGTTPIKNTGPADVLIKGAKVDTGTGMGVLGWGAIAVAGVVLVTSLKGGSKKPVVKASTKKSR